MKIKSVTTHTVEHHAELDEKQVYRCIAESVAFNCGLDINNDHVDFKVIIEKRERPGLTGFETFARVTIIEDISKLPTPG